MGINGKEMADQLVRQSSSYPLMGPESALGISAKVTREVIRGWMNRKHNSIGFVDKSKLRAFLKELLLRKEISFSRILHLVPSAGWLKALRIKYNRSGRVTTVSYYIILCYVMLCCVVLLYYIIL